MFGNVKRSILVAGTAVAMMIVAPLSFAEERVGDPYTLDTCPVSGGALDSKGEPVVEIIDGREVKFCCGGCPGMFAGDKETFFAKIDAQIVEQQKDHYPLETCPVSGGKLGSMGDPIDLVVNNRHVKICCAGCKEKLEADPASFIAKLDKAVIANQSKTYALKACPVSGEALTDSSINVVVGNRLVQICCAGCEAEVKDNPTKYFAMLDAGKIGEVKGHQH